MSIQTLDGGRGFQPSKVHVGSRAWTTEGACIPITEVEGSTDGFVPPASSLLYQFVRNELADLLCALVAAPSLHQVGIFIGVKTLAHGSH